MQKEADNEAPPKRSELVRKQGELTKSVVEEPRKTKRKTVMPADPGMVVDVGAGGYQICKARPSQFNEETRIGEPDLRPGRGHVVLSWIVRMERHERTLQDFSLPASVLKGRPAFSPAELTEAIELRTGILQCHIKVEVTCPEDFLVFFHNQQEKNAVFRCSQELFSNGVLISFKPWNRCCWAESSAIRFFTKISFDGLPLHAWEEEAMNKLINSLGGQLAELIPAADACCLGLFAWFKNPSDLPTASTAIGGRVGAMEEGDE